MDINRITTMLVTASFSEFAKLVEGEILARLWVPECAFLVAVLCFASFFHMSLAAAVTKFAKSSLEVLAHWLAITQRQSYIGKLSGFGQTIHVHRFSEI